MLSLKNNIVDYFSIKENFKSVEVVASEWSAKSYLDIVLCVTQMTGTSKEYKEGYEVDNDIALSTL